MTRVSGRIVDVLRGEVYPGTLLIQDGRIADIVRGEGGDGRFIVPPLVDSHVHVESSMLVPSRFARLAVVHGTVAALCDPHEIANVMGLEGVEFMTADGRTVPFKFYFGAPSCVPATPVETSGAELGPDLVGELLEREDIKFLAEVMNFPGVISGDRGLMAKIGKAAALGKRVDGHAPGLKGEALRRYIGAGIGTDHETSSLEEGLEKLRAGMKLQIREGSAAKNFDALLPLVDLHPDDCMFCSDDKHPHDLVRGHIDELVRRALSQGCDVMKVLRCASVNPVRHYGLDVGLLRKGDFADFVVVDNLEDFNVLQTCINGVVVAEEGESLIPLQGIDALNTFNTGRKSPGDFAVPKEGGLMNIIEVLDGQLITRRSRAVPAASGGCVVPDTGRDILKIAVVNRYRDAPPARAFVRNFGLDKGAIAASVAHDSHNIVAVGTSDVEISRAVNLVIRNRGGLAAVGGAVEEVLPLPVAGLMSDLEGREVAEMYERLDRTAKDLGSSLSAPFMTLSFMSLLVIPELKIGDRGLFDVEGFEPADLFVRG